MPSSSLPRSAAAAPRLRLALVVLAGGLCLAPAAAARVTLRPAARVAVAMSRGAGPRATAAAAGDPLNAAQVRAAYGLPRLGAAGQTIAVIVAYDDPAAASDLQAYSSRNGLPPCVGQPGCFTVLNEHGQAQPLPSPDPTGGQFNTEAAVGTQVARGVCPSCRILLVEATAADAADLASADDAAAAAGATVAVTAATPSEGASDSDHAVSFQHAGMTALAAAGDAPFDGEPGYGGGVYFPASLPQVLAVGGTNLTRRADGSYGSEQVWASTTTGCSLFEPAAPWQTALAAAAGCGARRLVADVAAMSTPGMLVHITGSGQPGGPWFAATGTSVSAPIIAGVIGLAGSMGSGESETLYARRASEPGALHDVTQGSNGSSCRPILCRGVRGYDAPSGVGTPAGLAAFVPSGGALSRRSPAVAAVVPRRGYPVDVGRGIQVTVRNANSAQVTGRLSIHRVVRSHGRLITLYAGAPLNVGPLGATTIRVTFPASWKPFLVGRGVLRARMDLRVKGPTGGSVTVSRVVTVKLRPR